MGTTGTGVFVVLTLLCVACGGNDSDGSGNGGGGGGSYPLGSRDEKCDGTGPTANDVLAFAEPEYTLSLEWVETGKTPTPLTLRVTYTNGALTCYRHISPPAGSAAPEIPPRVGVGVNAEFKTSDGTFAEAFETELGGEYDYASFTESIPAASFKGSFDPSMTGVESPSVAINAQLSQADTWGQVSKGGQKSGVGSTNPVANWDNR